MTGRSPPQTRVGDRFQITEWIGSGGIATVWRAVDESGGSDVAVKFPRQDGSNDDEVVRSQFEQAYETLTGVAEGIHPTALVRFVDGQLREPTYLVTEYIDGAELSSAVAGRRLTPGVQAATVYGFPIARALSFLHQNERMYLDIKPANALVRAAHDSPVLIDFNTAQPFGEDATLFHEDEYKAPEQVPATAERPTGPWSDVYGVGKLLAYLLTGETFLTSETPSGGVDVREYNPDIPAQVARVVRAATRADHERRPPDATRLVTRLRAAVGRPESLATLTDGRNGAVCPVRSGDTVGRVADGHDLPAIAISDPEQYVAPRQFALIDDDGWLVEDHSVNGTYVYAADQWLWLLGDEGYRQLQTETSREAPDQKPHTAASLSRQRTLAPVDPSYGIVLRFDPSP